MKITNIIFDLGGVIVYPKLGQWNIPYRASEILGHRAETMNSEDYKSAYKKAVVYLDESQLVSDTQEEYVLREKFITSLNRDMNWNMTRSEITALAEDFTFNIERYGFFDDVKPWLHKWKDKYSLGILSDALPSILLFIEQYGISEYFKSKVISAHVGATKPGREMYQAVLKSMGSNPENCVFIDDRICNVEAARSAGIHAIQMARSEFMPDAVWQGPVVHDFKELNTILESGELF